MANPLLDFVMSLVRDPDAAARYAADPARAIADADLIGVTSADVQNLIPVVAESLPMTTPLPESADNVWTSGAATAAFDSFEDRLPAPAVVDSSAPLTDIVDQSDPGPRTDPLGATGSTTLEDLVIQPSHESAFEDSDAAEAGVADDWTPPIADPDPGGQTPGFDVFD